MDLEIHYKSSTPPYRKKKRRRKRKEKNTMLAYRYNILLL